MDRDKPEPTPTTSEATRRPAARLALVLMLVLGMAAVGVLLHQVLLWRDPLWVLLPAGFGLGALVGGLFVGTRLGFRLAALAGILIVFAGAAEIRQDRLRDRNEIPICILYDLSKFEEAAMQILGGELARRLPGATVGVILRSADLERFDIRMQAKLREGLGDGMQLILIELDPLTVDDVHTLDGFFSAEQVDELLSGLSDPADTFTANWITAAQMDRAIAAHPEADVVISYIGLPMDYPQMAYWTWTAETRRPALVLMYAPLSHLKKAIAQDDVALVLHDNPDVIYRPNESMPDDPQVLFDRRYMFITPENVEAMAARYPFIFAKDPPAQEVTP